MFNEQTQVRRSNITEQNRTYIASDAPIVTVSDSKLPGYLKARITGQNGPGIITALENYELDKPVSETTLQDLAIISPEDLAYSTRNIGAKALGLIAQELIRTEIMTAPDALKWLESPGIRSDYRSDRYPCEQARKLVERQMEKQSVDLTRHSLSKLR